MTRALLDDHLLRDLLADDPSDGPGIRAAVVALDGTYRTVDR